MQRGAPWIPSKAIGWLPPPPPPPSSLPAPALLGEPACCCIQPGWSPASPQPCRCGSPPMADFCYPSSARGWTEVGSFLGVARTRDCVWVWEVSLGVWGGLADSPILASLRARQPGCPLRWAQQRGRAAAGTPPPWHLQVDWASQLWEPPQEPAAPWTRCPSQPASFPLPPRPSPVLTASLLPLSLLGCLHPSSPHRYKPLHSPPLPAPPHLLWFICVFLSLATTSSPQSNSAGSL